MAIISLAALLLILAGIMFFAVFLAIKRGLLHSGLRFVTLIVCLFISMLFSWLLADVITGAVGGMVSGLLTRILAMLGDIPSSADLINAVAKMAVGSLLFMLFFILTGSLSILADRPLAKLLNKKVALNLTDKANKLAGAGVGVLCGLLIFVCVMVPVSGISVFMGDVLTEAKSGDSVIPAAIDKFDVTPLSENFLVKASYALGGKPIFNSVSSTKRNGEKIKPDTLSDNVGESLSAVFSFTGRKFNEYTSKQGDALKQLSEVTGSSRLMADVFSETLAVICTEWSAGKDYRGIKAPVVSEFFQDTLKAFFTAFADETADTISDDLNTLADAFYILDKYQIFAKISFKEDIIVAAGTKGFVSELASCFYSNERCRELTPEFPCLSINLLCRYLPVNSELYGNLKSPQELTGTVRANSAGYTDEKFPAIALDMEGSVVNLAAMADIFFVSTVSEQKENLKDNADTVLRSLGLALDALSNSDLLGNDSTDDLLERVIHSNSLTQNMGLTGDSASKLLESIKGNSIDASGKKTYSTLLATLGRSVAALNAAKNVSTTLEDKKVKVSELLSDMSSSSTDVLKSMCDPAIIQSFGVSNEIAVKIADILSSLFTNLSGIKPGDASYNKEVDAVTALFVVALSATDGKGKAFLGADSRSGMTADEMINTLSGSKTVEKTLIESVKESNPFKLSEGLKDTEKSELSSAIEKAETSAECKTSLKMIFGLS